jgi:hypothetical protein
VSARTDTLRAELCEAFGVTVIFLGRAGTWCAIVERDGAKHEVVCPTRAMAEDAALDCCGAPATAVAVA